MSKKRWRSILISMQREEKLQGSYFNMKHVKQAYKVYIRLPKKHVLRKCDFWEFYKKLVFTEMRYGVIQMKMNSKQLDASARAKGGRT
ncbi:hypothetical protein [Enterococcus sp. LJL51]|uniref:hypothetical protein n=1 Tax=Enterococcus sp. LJL51 TaxID=3416656 RepID=UPI003CEF91D3